MVRRLSVALTAQRGVPVSGTPVALTRDRAETLANLELPPIVDYT